jgi:disease resistance protein RPM1
MTGAMGILAPKLLDLLQQEYNLQAGLSNEVRSLSQELEHIDAFIRKVSDVPWDRLDEQVKVWAREAREASYGIEDAIDSFLLARARRGRRPGRRHAQPRLEDGCRSVRQGQASP